MHLFHDVLNDEIYILREGGYMCYMNVVYTTADLSSRWWTALIVSMVNNTYTDKQGDSF